MFVLTFLGAVFWALGWLTAKVVLAVLWIGAALRLGWTDAHKKRLKT